MNDQKWITWKMQTSKTWDDISDVMILTRIDFIDYDHKMLVEYALELNNLIHQSEKDFSLELLNRIGDLLNDLYTYAVAHFGREEKFMEKNKLPATEDHKIEHSRILGIIKSKVDDYSHGKVNISQELKAQIMDWLMNHINVTDHEFFKLENWNQNLTDAKTWEDVCDIIYMTGIRKVDEQHRGLSERAIEILDSAYQAEDLKEDLEKFKRQVREHFDFEESFMSKNSINTIEEHRLAHSKFMEELEEVFVKLLGKEIEIDEVKGWLLTWWIDHINQQDSTTFSLENWAYITIDQAEDYEDIEGILRLTGIEAVDNDHRQVMKETIKLNKKITQLEHENRDLREAEIKSQLLKDIDYIYGLAEKHFRREERIMNKHHVESCQNHTKEHHDILERLLGIRQNYMLDRLYISSNLKNTILEWWIHHTNSVDYRTFVLQLNQEAIPSINEEEVKQDE